MKIITKEGKGRPINPYYNNANDLYEDKNRRFNILNPPLTVYDTEGNLYMGEGEVEATLIMQKRMQYDWCDEPSDYKWEDCEDCEVDEYDPITKTSYEHRQIYRISTPIKQEKESVEQVALRLYPILMENSYPSDTSMNPTQYDSQEDSRSAFILGANWQLKQSNLIDRDKVIELINEVSKTFTGPDATLALFKAITKIKEL